MIDIVMKSVFCRANNVALQFLVKGYPKGHAPLRSKASYKAPPNPPHPHGRHPFNIITEEIYND